jgi:hypothetical protein
MTTQRETSQRSQILALRRQVETLERRNDELALWADKFNEMQAECAALQIRANTAEDKLAALSAPVDTEDTPLSPDAARWADAYFATLKELGGVRTRLVEAESERDWLRSYTHLDGGPHYPRPIQRIIDERDAALLKACNATADLAAARAEADKHKLWWESSQDALRELMHDEIPAARAEAKALRSSLEDFRDRGCRHDLNPTMVGEWDSSQWHRYIASMDRMVRERAAAALRAASSPSAARR